MNFEQLRSFYLVATMGTFQQAAEKLNTSQPTISARIAALERLLREKLFDRSGYKVTLTDAGSRFLPFAEKLLETHGNALFEIGRSSKNAGVIRIGASATMAISWMPKFFVELQKHFEGLLPEIRTGNSPELRDLLVAGMLDICFIVGPVAEPEILNTLICECPVGLVASPQLGLQGHHLSVEQINNYKLVTLDRRTHTYQTIYRDLAVNGSVKQMCSVSSLQVTTALALAGYGIAVAPLAGFHREIENGELVVLDCDLEFSTPSFVICRRNTAALPIIDTMIQQAVKFLRKEGNKRFVKVLC